MTATDPQHLLGQAVTHHTGGNIVRAAALYRRVLCQEPAHLDALHLLGLAEQAGGNPAHSAALIGRATVIHAGFAELWNNLAIARAQLGHTAEAIDGFRNALARKPDLEPARRGLVALLPRVPAGAIDPIPAELAQDVTLIIPTHKRHGYLARALDYYSRSGMRILVGDSTPTPFPGPLPASVDYRHYPDVVFGEKLRRMAEDVHTPYTLISADDDFIIPQAVSRCVSFLRSNPSYATAHGHFLAFYELPERTAGVRLYPDLEDWHLEQDSPVERMRALMSCYMHQFYAVHHTDTLKKTFGILGEYTGSNCVLEIMVGLVSCIQGRHRTLPLLYGARQQGNADGLYYRLFNNLDWNGADRTEYPRVMGGLAALLADSAEMTLEQAHEAIAGATALYGSADPSSPPVPAPPPVYYDFQNLDRDLGACGRWSFVECRHIMEIASFIRAHGQHRAGNG